MANLNALLVPLDDAAALADAIDRLARDPQLRRKFGQASRELVERKFSSQRIGRDLIALYRMRTRHNTRSGVDMRFELLGAAAFVEPA